MLQKLAAVPGGPGSLLNALGKIFWCRIGGGSVLCSWLHLVQEAPSPSLRNRDVSWRYLSCRASGIQNARPWSWNCHILVAFSTQIVSLDFTYLFCFSLSYMAFKRRERQEIHIELCPPAIRVYDISTFEIFFKSASHFSSFWIVLESITAYFGECSHKPGRCATTSDFITFIALLQSYTHYTWFLPVFLCLQYMITLFSLISLYLLHLFRVKWSWGDHY